MTYIITAFVSITVGLAVGVALTFLLAVAQTQLAARGRRLARAADTEIYFPQPLPTTTTTTGVGAATPPGVVVYRSVDPVNPAFPPGS